jgi:hypothetical protein
VVELMPHKPKVVGSTPAGIGIENGIKRKTDCGLRRIIDAKEEILGDQKKFFVVLKSG